MMTLSNNHYQELQNLAQKYQVQVETVICLLQALQNGQGTMAQFNCPELGGSGQWMQGGMTMVGDMFNYQLQNLVNNLCAELSQWWQYNAQELINNNAGNQSSAQWWPAELGSPAATGQQNEMSYAYFPNQRRLAVKRYNQITVYDTLNHSIGGFSQQQGGGDNISFSSQFGTVNLTSLPQVFPASQNTPEPPPPTTNIPPNNPNTPNMPTYAEANEVNATNSETDIFLKIERLAELQQKGILTPEEFAEKKQELLKRL